MNRAELVDKLAANHMLSRAAADRILDDVFDSVIQAVKKHGSIRFVGFGSFTSVKRAARRARNPHTGEAVKVAARTVPKFVPGAAFKAAIDPKAAAAKKAKAQPAAPAARNASSKGDGRGSAKAASGKADGRGAARKPARAGAR